MAVTMTAMSVPNTLPATSIVPKNLCGMLNISRIIFAGLEPDAANRFSLIRFEAITDIYNAISIGVTGVIAPMAETAFAVSKFLNAVETFVAEDNRKDIDFAINIETITAFNNLDSILALPNISILQGITIGRVDFVGSMGHDRGQVDSDEIYSYCSKIFTKARQHNLKTGLGGAISTGSIDFIKNL